LKLTKEEVDVMVKVRDKMRAAYELGDRSRYICWTIIEVIEGRNTMYNGVCLLTQLTALGGMAKRLHSHINWALKGNGTMASFIAAETERFGYQFMRWAEKFEAEARLAWLDRMIEMEDIK
jgi:hypothetical protein